MARPSSVLVAVDLDQTLIFSAGALARAGWGTDDDAGNWLQVEDHDGSRSFVSRALRGHLDLLRSLASVVPVTTRTRSQFERVASLGTVGFDPCICANGAIMLVNGSPDSAWAAEVAKELTPAWSLEEVRIALDELVLSRTAARLADDMFCYVVVDDVPSAGLQVRRIRDDLEPHGWGVCLVGRKLYALPSQLTKAAAVDRLARRLGAEVVVAIGDSMLDLPMLERADYSIAPAHADEGVLDFADYVTPTSGPPAAIEALRAATEWLSRPQPGARRAGD